MTVDLIWKKFPIKQVEVKLSKVLRCGQTFRWKNVNDIWSYTTENKIILLKQDEEYIHYSWIAAEHMQTQLKINCHFDKETLDFIRIILTYRLSWKHYMKNGLKRMDYSKFLSRNRLSVSLRVSEY